MGLCDYGALQNENTRIFELAWQLFETRMESKSPDFTILHSNGRVFLTDSLISEIMAAIQSPATGNRAVFLYSGTFVEAFEAWGNSLSIKLQLNARALVHRGPANKLSIVFEDPLNLGFAAPSSYRLMGFKDGTVKGDERTGSVLTYDSEQVKKMLLEMMS